MPDLSVCPIPITSHSRSEKERLRGVSNTIQRFHALLHPITVFHKGFLLDKGHLLPSRDNGLADNMDPALQIQPAFALRRRLQSDGHLCGVLHGFA